MNKMLKYHGHVKIIIIIIIKFFIYRNELP